MRELLISEFQDLIKADGVDGLAATLQQGPIILKTHANPVAILVPAKDPQSVIVGFSQVLEQLQTPVRE